MIKLWWNKDKPQIRKGLTPDFIGSWSLGELNLNDGLFYMYINSMREIEGSPRHRIGGSIDDKFGAATFTGEISEDSIRFSKEYDKQASRKINPDQYPEIFYEAKKVNGIFIGTYEMRGFEIITYGWGFDTKEKGKFILYSPTPENQRKSESKQVPIS